MKLSFKETLTQVLDFGSPALKLPSSAQTLHCSSSLHFITDIAKPSSHNVELGEAKQLLCRNSPPPGL